ncbi:Protein of unknown function [Nitrosomonas ureae]|uniref:DUF1566 domain-containing protein n=1 Tax=Nitrosomonas ureae TaxID=44577 RepID=A0A285BZU1_9PROT|nr:DUF1566 domain-containing protein [Nitrosomonas ureae]SNX60388.1 Protein of unknown function [Nitrosomonas ureae]
MKQEQSIITLGLLFFSIAIMLYGNAFAADKTPHRVTQPEFDAAISTINSKISDIKPSVRTIGEVLPDNSIVFWVDETGQHGLAAQPFDEDGQFNWYVAKEMADSRGPGWRLPSKHELNLLYLQKEIVGSFDDNSYWSSNEYDATNMWYQSFFDGSKGGFDRSSYSLSVRAVRAF